LLPSQHSGCNDDHSGPDDDEGVNKQSRDGRNENQETYDRQPTELAKSLPGIPPIKQ